MNRAGAHKRGISLVEVILAATVFMLFASGVTTAVIQNFYAARQAREMTVAVEYATLGSNAVKSIRKNAFANLVNTVSSGIDNTSGTWVFSGTSNTYLTKYQREISVSDVYRDGSNNIVTSGGTLDPLTKRVDTDVTWNITPSKQNTVTLVNYFTNFKLPIGRRGMIVYTSGGTTDVISYNIFDSSTQSWQGVSTLADIDGTSTNRIPVVVRVYSSSVDNTKIVLSKHYNGTTQYIYGQYFNGTTWGNVQLLGSFASTTNVYAESFDGAYMTNGTFMAVYSDNTAIPKYRTFSSGVWSGQASLPTMTNVVIYITLKMRPATNELMGAFFNTSRATRTSYWSGSAWSAVTSHATAAPYTNRDLVDFVWNTSNPLQGILVYTSNNTATTFNSKIFTANGTGGGAWGSANTSATVGSTVSHVVVDTQATSNAYISCVKDSQTTPDIECFNNSSTGVFTTPTGSQINANSFGTVEQTHGLNIEKLTSTNALIVYSDNTASPKYKIYTPTTWSSTINTINVGAYVPSTIKSVKTYGVPQSDDAITLLSDTANDLYSVVYNGSTNSMYTSPVGAAFYQHTTNGYASTGEWFDFAWDLN